MKIKKVAAKGKTILKKKDIPKQQKKILSTNGGEMTQKHTTNQVLEKLKYFGVKYSNQENITKKTNEEAM